MYFLLNMMIFQAAMSVYQRVNKSKFTKLGLSFLAHHFFLWSLPHRCIEMPYIVAPRFPQLVSSRKEALCGVPKKNPMSGVENGIHQLYRKWSLKLTPFKRTDKPLYPWGLTIVISPNLRKRHHEPPDTEGTILVLYLKTSPWQKEGSGHACLFQDDSWMSEEVRKWLVSGL